MYSPSSSPRKGPFGSAKGSPRKTLLSPSDVTPFSYNGPDGFNIFGSELLSQTNGIIPMSSPMMDQQRIPLNRSTSSNLNQNSSSRPRTQSLIPLGKSHSVGSGGGVMRLRPTGSAGGGDGFGNEGSVFSGKSVKEYDNTLRDLQRDNFNLKLRIYFLEERMGQGSNFSPSSDKSSDDSVIDLKMAVERLKYDNNEKTELLQEARFAIEDLENQLNAASQRRAKEMKGLEEKVKNLEADLLKESRIPPLPNKQLAQLDPSSSNGSSLYNSPAHKRVMSSGEEFGGDSDDSLLREVEIEMRRKINFEGSGTQQQPHLSVVIENKEKEEVVGRQQELEDRVEKLNHVIKETEKTLRNAQNDVSTRIIEIEGLKSQLNDKECQIKDLNAKLEKLNKSDIAKEAEILDLRCKRDETLELLDKAKIDLESEILKYDKGLRRKERIIKDLTNEVEIKNKRIQELQIKLKVRSLDAFEKDMLSKDEESDTERNDFGLATCVVTPTTAIPNPMESNGNSNKWGLDVVTQSLHIPPSNKNRIPTWEVKKLREDIRILRDYLKIRVAEKKSLLQQIAELNKRIVNRRSVSAKSWSTPPPLHEVVTVGSQTDDTFLDKYSLKGRLLTLAESLRLCESPHNVDKIICDLKSLASALVLRERRESGGSSEWHGGLPDPSLLLPELEFDEAQQSDERLERLYSFQSNHGIGDILDNYSIYSMMEQFNPTEPGSPQSNEESFNVDMNMNNNGEGEEEEEEDDYENQATAFHSEDSWSQPDVSEARNRMGIPPLTLKLTTGSSQSHNIYLENEEKESDLNTLSPRTSDRKSFYALEYTTQNLSHSDKEESNLDYSDETSRKYMESGLDETSFAQEDCIMGNCLRENLYRIKTLMESLTYELDSCNSISSELSDEEDNLYSHSVGGGVRENSPKRASTIQVCFSCSSRLSEDLQNHLISSNTLLQCSTLTIQRLKRIIRSHEIHSEKSRQELHYTMNRLSELESSLMEARVKSEEMETSLRAQLETKIKEIDVKSKENQNLKTKLNENYNLVAQLSTENLSLSKEKMKLEEALNNSSGGATTTNETSSPEQSKRQYPLEKMNSSFRPLSHDCNGSWTVSLKDNRHSSNLRSSPETSSSFDFLPENSSRTPAHNNNNNIGRSSSNTNVNNNQFVPLTPPPTLRLNRFGSRSSLRKKYQNRNSYVISEAEESPKLVGSKEGGNKHFRSIGNLSGASDVSSPDLGVDMSSSDPFSSLERRCLSNSDAMNSIMHENYQLRRQNKLLIEKLSWPGSNFKDTMD